MTEYIDKKKVIDIINTTCPDFNIPEINDSWAHKLIVIIREALVEFVKKEPAADVRENAKGKWIESDPLDYYIFYKCSICRHSGNEAFDFCPNCGADMRGNYD